MVCISVMIGLCVSVCCSKLSKMLQNVLSPLGFCFPLFHYTTQNVLSNWESVLIGDKQHVLVCTLRILSQVQIHHFASYFMIEICYESRECNHVVTQLYIQKCTHCKPCSFPTHKLNKIHTMSDERLGGGLGTRLRYFGKSTLTTSLYLILKPNYKANILSFTILLIPCSQA